jgi:hypothetical protein
MALPVNKTALCQNDLSATQKAFWKLNSTFSSSYSAPYRQLTVRKKSRALFRQHNSSLFTLLSAYYLHFSPIIMCLRAREVGSRASMSNYKYRITKWKCDLRGQ